MQVFLDDGAVLFADAWALTRVDPRGRVKHAPGLFAAPVFPLSHAGSPPAVLTRGRSSLHARRLDAATLKIISPAPVGAPDLALDDGCFLLEDRVLSADGATRSTLSAPRARPDLTLRLGEPGVHRCVPHRVHRGALVRVVHTPGGASACLYDLRVEGSPLVLQVDVVAPALSVLDAAPDRDGLTLACWQPHARAATLVRVDRSGRETARVSVDAITLPVVDGGRVVAQSNARTLRSTPLDGSAATDFSLDAIARDDVGPGMVLADRGRTLFVPWHGETLLDLDRQLFIDRKLPAKHAALRACVTRHLRDQRDTLLRDGVERVASLRESSRRVGIILWLVPHPATARSARSLLQPLTEALAAMGFTVDGYATQG